MNSMQQSVSEYVLWPDWWDKKTVCSIWFKISVDYWFHSVFFCMLSWIFSIICFKLLLLLFLRGNSTLKNISPKMNIYDKQIYVSVIKLMMHTRYRMFLTIKLLISRHVFLRGGGNSRPSSLFLYLCLFVDVDMVTRNGCSYVLLCVKTSKNIVKMVNSCCS